jgi:hypothetical protein
MSGAFFYDFCKFHIPDTAVNCVNHVSLFVNCVTLVKIKAITFVLYKLIQY